MHAYEQDQVLFLRRWWDADEVGLVFHFGASPTTLTLSVPAGQWQKRLDSAEAQWHGPGSPTPALVVSDGERSLTISGQASILFIRTDAPRLGCR